MSWFRLSIYRAAVLFPTSATESIYECVSGGAKTKHAILPRRLLWNCFLYFGCWFSSALMTKRIRVSPQLGVESFRLADSIGDHVREDSRVTQYRPTTRSFDTLPETRSESKNCGSVTCRRYHPQQALRSENARPGCVPLWNVAVLGGFSVTVREV